MEALKRGNQRKGGNGCRRRRERKGKHNIKKQGRKVKKRKRTESGGGGNWRAGNGRELYCLRGKAENWKMERVLERNTFLLVARLRKGGGGGGGRSAVQPKEEKLRREYKESGR